MFVPGRAVTVTPEVTKWTISSASASCLCALGGAWERTSCSCRRGGGSLSVVMVEAAPCGECLEPSTIHAGENVDSVVIL
jgi:hypothetical protein